MRLNLRLMGVLFGILLIGLTGYILLRSTSGYRIRDDRDDDRGGRNLLPLIGLALYVIGYVGVFFANLIKSAVSRQREFLADASAVQFTRNPDGIAGALKKIGALSAGSAIQEPRAEEASHMFFGSAGGSGELFGLLATHPPLVERIRRLDPSFDGDFSKVRLDPPGDELRIRPMSRRGGRARGRLSSTRRRPSRGWARLRAPQLLYAAGLLEDLSPTISVQLHDPLGAQATVFALLLDPQETVCREQLDWLDQYAHPAVVRQMRAVMAEVMKLAPEERLPLVERAVPALRQMSPAQMREFLSAVKALVEADKKLTIFEYALQRLLLRHLVAYFVKRPSSACEVHDFRAARRSDNGCALCTRPRWPVVARSGRGGICRGSESTRLAGGPRASSRRRVRPT